MHEITVVQGDTTNGDTDFKMVATWLVRGWMNGLANLLLPDNNEPGVLSSCALNTTSIWTRGSGSCRRAKYQHVCIWIDTVSMIGTIVIVHGSVPLLLLHPDLFHYTLAVWSIFHGLNALWRCRLWTLGAQYYCRVGASNIRQQGMMKVYRRAKTLLLQQSLLTRSWIQAT